MKNKKPIVIFTVIFSVIACLGTFILLWFWGDEYPDFENFSQGLEIPGLDDGGVPQGLCSYNTYVYDENGAATTGRQEYFFISEYMKSGPTRIYVTGAQTGCIGYVTVKYDGGEGEADYFGHAGGIATSCKRDEASGTFWIASDDTVFCIKGSDTSRNPAEEIIAKAKLADGENVIKVTDSFAANCNASFCYFFEDGTTSVLSDKLYVGEFYHPTNAEYATDESHHITTKSGENQCAFVYEYTASATSKYGVVTLSDSKLDDDNRVPQIQAVYSIPEKVQGFARLPDGSGSTNGKIVLSQSWALSNSTLTYYEYQKVHASSNRESYDKLKTYTGSSGETRGSGLMYKGVTDKSGQPYYGKPYVYFIDGGVLEREYSVPSMSEGICAVNSRVYVLFESASYKYGLFVRQQLRNIYYFTPTVKR